MNPKFSRRKILDFIGTCLATILVVAFTTLTSAIAQTPELKWRMPTSWPASLNDSIQGAAKLFAQRVGELSGGKFQIQVFAAGEIVPPLSVLDAIQNGTVELGHTTSYYYWGKDPALAFGSSIGFGLNARQQIAWMRLGGGDELLQEIFKKFNVHGLPAGETGAQMGGWFRNELKTFENPQKTVDQLNGLKFRIGGFAGHILKRLGVVAQQIPGGEIYQALERGAIDATEWIGPYDDERLGFHKVAKNYYYPAWWEGNTTIHVFINLDKWNSLSPQYKTILQVAARDAGQWLLATYDIENPKALKRLVAAGVTLRPFPQAIMDASYDAAKEVYKETSAVNPNFKKLHDSLVAYRKESYEWISAAEFWFDNYQIRKARER